MLKQLSVLNSTCLQAEKAPTRKKPLFKTFGYSTGKLKSGKRSNTPVKLLVTVVTTKWWLHKIVSGSSEDVVKREDLTIFTNLIPRQMLGHRCQHLKRLLDVEDLVSKLLHLAILYTSSLDSLANLGQTSISLTSPHLPGKNKKVYL
jgi:hypothetical protein